MDDLALRALATPRRREILRLCWDEERCAGDIHARLPDVTFGAVSQHLKILEDAGLLQSRAQGRHRWYRAQQASLGPLIPALHAMWNDALYTLKLQAELEYSRRGPRPARGRRRKR